MHIEKLKKISLFYGLSEQTLSDFHNYFQLKTFEPGYVIFKEDTEGDTLYIIVDGEVFIEKRLDAEESEHKVLAVLTDGEFFGEMAVLENQHRFAQARVGRQSVLYEIRRDDFYNFIKQKPESGIHIYNGIMRTLLKRLRHTSNELTMLFDLCRQLMVQHKTPADFLAISIDEIRPYLDGKWNFNAFIYNMFNEEYDQCYEFTSYSQPAEERVMPSKPVNGWADSRTYFMVLERDGRKLGCVRFCKEVPVDKAEKYNLETILNTISYIINANIVDVEHQAELALIAKLKKAKSY